jgi:hypothetical protein
MTDTPYEAISIEQKFAKFRVQAREGEENHR